MNAPKRRIARVRPGLYNYRAYCIFKAITGGWYVENEEGGIYTKTRTLRAMRRKIDGWIREEEAEAQRAEQA